LFTFLINNVLSTWPLVKGYSIRKLLNYHTMTLVLVSNHTEPFLVCKHSWDVCSPQILVVDLHTLLLRSCFIPHYDTRFVKFISKHTLGFDWLVRGWFRNKVPHFISLKLIYLHAFPSTIFHHTKLHQCFLIQPEKKKSHVVTQNPESRTSRDILWDFSNYVIQGEVFLSSPFSRKFFKHCRRDFFALLSSSALMSSSRA